MVLARAGWTRVPRTTDRSARPLPVPQSRLHEPRSPVIGADGPGTIAGRPLGPPPARAVQRMRVRERGPAAQGPEPPAGVRMERAAGARHRRGSAVDGAATGGDGADDCGRADGGRDGYPMDSVADGDGRPNGESDPGCGPKPWRAASIRPDDSARPAANRTSAAARPEAQGSGSPQTGQIDHAVSWSCSPGVRRPASPGPCAPAHCPVSRMSQWSPSCPHPPSVARMPGGRGRHGASPETRVRTSSSPRARLRAVFAQSVPRRGRFASLSGTHADDHAARMNRQFTHCAHLCDSP